MSDKLTILWTNADPMTAEMMVFMYANGAMTQGFWDEVEIIIWGATAKLSADNEKIRSSIKELMKNGVKFRACKHCAELLGVDSQLWDLGIELEYMGQPLTEVLKTDGKLLTV